MNTYVEINRVERNEVEGNRLALNGEGTPKNADTSVNSSAARNDEKTKVVKTAKKSLLFQWRRDVRTALERDPAARNTIEVITTYPGVHAIMIHRLSHRLWLRGARYIARLLACITRLITNVDIHPGAVIGEDFFIDHGAGVVIGETSVIGNRVTLYHGVTLGGTSWSKGKRHPSLGDNVMVGAGAKILGPINIGNGSRVGANSVVVADVPESCTVVGIPGKIVKVREAGRQNAYGVDLDHHLIPDPVGKLIACMLERIETLESRVVHLTGVTQGEADADADADEICCEPDNEICEVHCAIAAS